MATRAALAAAAALIALAFTLSTAERWWARRRAHDLAWAVALAMFTVASVALWSGASLGWGGRSFRVFYLLGGVVTVPVLALGTVSLLGGPLRARRWAMVVALGSAFAAGVVTVAPLRAPVPVDRLPRGSEVFGALPRALAAGASATGAAVVLGGAVLSAVRARRRGGPATRRMVAANGLIALGTVLLSAGGLANSVVGEMEAFALSLVAGVGSLFAGFLVAVARSPVEPPERPRAGAAEGSAQDEELHDGGHEDGEKEQAHHDGGRRPHPA